MKRVRMAVSVIVLTFCGAVSEAQQVVATNTNVAVPPLVNFSGTLTASNGKPLSGTVGVTFSLYSDQTSGAALWMESQNVQPDTLGHYTVTLGSTSSTGLPAEIFVAGQAHWLGVQVEGEAYEQPRILLVSAPYALKAGDAQTLGGMPASAFVLAAPPSAGSAPARDQATSTSSSSSAMPASSSDVTTTGGTINALSLFSTPTNIQNSLLTQTGTTAINVGGKLNLPATGTATSTVAFNSRPLDFVASEYNSGTSTAVAETFQWQAQPTSNDSSSPAATLNLLYGLGTNSPAQTGLRIASNGLITFAPGQTFVGTGSATGYGVEGESANVGVYGTSTNGIGVEGVTSNGVAGMFALNNTGGKLLEGTTNGVTEFTVDYKGDLSTNGSINAGSIVGTGPNATSAGVEGISGGSSGYGLEGVATSTTGSSVGVYGTSSAPKGYGVEGVSPNVGLFGQGNYGVDAHGSGIAVKGTASVSGAYSGWFQGGPVLITGNGNNMVAGDPGCGAGYAGIGLHGNLSNCKDYTLLADTTGDTYVNSTGGTGIHFRNNNNGGNSNGDLATIDNSGNLTVAGKVHSGNAAASVVASNRTVASTGDCVLPLSAPDSNCLTPNMTLTVTTSGGPVLIMANIGGVEPAIGTDEVSVCAYPNFYLVMDSQIIATQNLGINGSDYYGLTATMISLQTPAAGKHTFQVQEADDASQCGSGDYSPTLISLNLDAPSWPSPTRTLIVREF